VDLIGEILLMFWCNVWVCEFDVN